MYCSKCGQEVADGVNYCSACGCVLNTCRENAVYNVETDYTRNKLDQMHEGVDNFFVLSIISLLCYVFGLILDLFFYDYSTNTINPMVLIIGLVLSIAWIVLVLKNKSKLQMINFLIDDEYYFTNQEYFEYNQIKSKFAAANIIHKIAYFPLIITTWVVCIMIALSLVMALFMVFALL